MRRVTPDARGACSKLSGGGSNISNPGAANSLRDGSEETLAVMRRRQSATIMLCWSAAGVIEADPGFR